MEESLYYRPEWTCGRFNESSSCAIMYNLIEGYSYYFEDYSALVVGEILKIKKWDGFSPYLLSNNTGIAIESIKEFILTLCDVGLLTDDIYNSDDINSYRTAICLERKKSHKRAIERHSEDSFGTRSTAEELFLKKAPVCGSVMLELTYRCSEKCIHCYNPGASRNDTEESHRSYGFQEINIDDYKTIIDDLYDNGLFKVCLTGGDPFAKEGVWEIIDYLYEKEIAFDIFTNGQSLYGKEERLAKRYPRSVGLSIYSLEDEIHDGITRVKGSLSRTVSVTRRLSDLSVPEYIKCCVMKANLNSYHTIYSLADEVGAKLQVDINVSDSIDGDKCVRTYLKPSEEEYKILLRDPNTLSYVDINGEDYTQFDLDFAINQRPCNAGIKSFCICPDGSVIPCCAFHYILGNILKSSIKEIVNTQEYHKWEAITLKDYDKCVSCKHIAFCSLCSGFNYAENGKITEPSYDNCFLAEIRSKLFSELSNGNDPLKGLDYREALSQFPKYAHCQKKVL